MHHRSQELQLDVEMKELQANPVTGPVRAPPFFGNSALSEALSLSVRHESECGAAYHSAHMIRPSSSSHHLPSASHLEPTTFNRQSFNSPFFNRPIVSRSSLSHGTSVYRCGLIRCSSCSTHIAHTTQSAIYSLSR